MQTIYDLIVIGAGPGGYVAAISAAKLGLKTLCIEERKTLGGTCLNVGCIPSKALLSSTHLYHQMMHQAQLVGISCQDLSYDFSKMQGHKDKVVLSLTQGISFLFKKYQVEHLQGKAILCSGQEVEVDQKRYQAKAILLATGSIPIAFPNLAFDEKRILSSTGALALEKVPKELAILGAGAIGVEIGSIYARLGSKVDLIESLDRICPLFDQALSKELEKLLIKQGLSFHLQKKLISVEEKGDRLHLLLQGEKGVETLEKEALLVSIGRRPNTQGLGLEALGISFDSKGRIPVNHSFQTKIPTLFAIGDLIDGPMLAHKASEEGLAVAEILAGKTPTIDYLQIPNVVYTSPEVASVGLTEEEVKAYGIPYKVAQFPMKASARARTSLEEEGFVKMIEGNGRLLGVHIIASHASEWMVEATLAIRLKKSAKEMAATCHAHPTLSEALKECALMLEGHQIHL